MLLHKEMDLVVSYFLELHVNANIVTTELNIFQFNK